jgi:CHAT domain-containing protein
MNQLNVQHSALTRSVEEKRAQVLREIEDADAFFSADVPSVASVRAELQQLAARCSGPAQRSLLVEFFHLDMGDVLVFLAPLWNLDQLELQRLSFPPGFILKIAIDLLANTTTDKTRAPANIASQLPDQTMTSLLNLMSSLVQPWSDYLDKWQPTELIISPHSVLNLLPIHAAICRGSALIERFPVAYLPSPALASTLLQRYRRGIDTALLIGNPNADLKNAEREIDEISKKLVSVGAEVQSFYREQATTESVQKHAGEASVVHLACHSEIDHADFLRSGFLLSDRRMTVLEIMSSIELKRASLVYLSSCDSARPVVGRTEELMALARYFLYAGSPTIIASLWPLDDETGCIFAEHFYNAWLSEGVSTIRAFQTAILRTRETTPDPMYWAPFVIIGAW